MADRRMISQKIVDTDKFVEMPVSARLLYYELCVRGDDDGFVSSPNKILRMIGCSSDDLKLLCAKNYIIPFESGVCVIKDWKIHNYIQTDRYKPTIYTEEFSQLQLKENKEYFLDTECIQIGYNMDTVCTPNINQININKNKRKKQYVRFFDYSNYPDIDPVVIQDCIHKFGLLWGSWMTTRRGNQNETKQVYEQVANETGLNIFVDQLELAFCAYYNSKQWSDLIIKSMPKWLQEYENWLQEYKENVRDKKYRAIEKGEIWGELIEHVNREKERG